MDKKQRISLILKLVAAVALVFVVFVWEKGSLSLYLGTLRCGVSPFGCEVYVREEGNNGKEVAVLKGYSFSKKGPALMVTERNGWGPWSNWLVNSTEQIGRLVYWRSADGTENILCYAENVIGTPQFKKGQLPETVQVNITQTDDRCYIHYTSADYSAIMKSNPTGLLHENGFITGYIE